MSPEAWLQAGASIIAAAFVVGGAVYGARVGARIGADATREAMERSIADERARQSKADLDESWVALRAVIIELDLNLVAFRQFSSTHLFLPLEREALREARPFIAKTPEPVVEAIQQAHSEISAYNTLVHYFNLRAANAGGNVQRFNSQLVKNRFDMLGPALEAARAQLHYHLTILPPLPNVRRDK